MKKQNVSIRDVAQAAGVSIATVSNVLKGTGRVSEPTLKRVWNIVNELNYTPNPYAQKLFHKEPVQREKTGMLMRVSYWPSVSPIHDEFEKDLLFEFDKACREKNYLGTSYVYRDEKGFQCTQIVKGLIDGAILCTSHLDLLETLKGRLPAVLLEVPASEKELGYPVVATDFESAYIEAVKKLKELGISGKMASVQGVLRSANKNRIVSVCDPFSQVAEICGNPISPEHVIEFETTSDTAEEDGIVLAEQLKKMIREDGIRIIKVRSISFPSVYQNLLKLGVRCPEEAVFLPFFNEPFSAPGVIPIIPDIPLLISKAVEVLDRYINGKETEIKKFLVPVKKLDFSGVSKQK